MRGLPLAEASADAGSAVAPAARERDLRTSIRPTVAQVDLGALRRNCERLRALIGPGVGIYGVVKADAYGHGAIAVARVLEPLCDALAVSLVEEGLELRAAGIGKPIVVLGAYYGRRHSDVLEEGLTPVVYDVADLERFAEAPTRRLRRVRSGQARRNAGDERVDIHVKVDTGMSRLGVPAEALGAFLDRAAALPRLRVSGLCTHLASADASDSASTQAQLALFNRTVLAARARGVEPAILHAANSAAAIRFPDLRFGAVRPGIALYGAMPSDVVSLAGLEPVLRLETRIMALHAIPVGAGVSYGGTFRAARPSVIATLPIGYADGYPRHVRDAHVLVRGQRAPLAGVVCMDMTMVDVTDVPGVSVGDAVTLVGSDGALSITIDDVAARAGTVNYEIMCGISKRVPRVYRDDTGTGDGR